MKKTLLFTIAAVFISSVFTGCYDPIFYEVRKDVVPESSTVSGAVNEITRYTAGDKEFLVLAADSGIRYKDITMEVHGAWQEYDNLPEDFSFHSYDYYTSTHNGYQILKVLADETNLYLVGASYTDDNDLGITIVDHIKIWTKAISLGTASEEYGATWSDEGSWSVVVDDTEKNYFKFFYYSDYLYSAFSIFQTNAPQKANRYVFIRSGNASAYDDDYTTTTYYQLSKGKITSISAAPADSTSVSNISSAAVLNGKVVFFNSPVAVTNETYTKAATRVYFADDSTLCCNDADNSTKLIGAVDAGQDISAIAYCADSLIIGRADYSSTSTSSYGGVVRVKLSNGTPESSLSDFDTNAEFQLSSAYFINAIINSTPDRTETESALYASLSFLGSGSSSNVSYDNIGLWSYYPARGNWNRE